MEELARLGVHTFIRIGTCGTLQDYVNIGDVAVFDSAMRLEGTSPSYVAIEYPAVADHDVVTACLQACETLGLPHHLGVTRSADTFYARHPRPGSSFNNYWIHDWKHHFEDLKAMNVVAAEMEASVIFVLAKVWGLRAGGIATVLDNMLKVTGETGEFDPQEGFDHSEKAVADMTHSGCEAIRILYEMDQKKPFVPHC